MRIATFMHQTKCNPECMLKTTEAHISNLWEACTATCVHYNSNIFFDWEVRISRIAPSEVFDLCERGNFTVTHLVDDTGITGRLLIVKINYVSNACQA